jgi:hypothetical protein
MSLRLRLDDGLPTPADGGTRPRWRLPLLVAAPLVAASLIAACSKGSGDQVTNPAALGMTVGTQPDYSDGEIKLFEVYQAVPLPVRKPTDAEEQALGAAPKGTGYPRAPFLTADDESVEVHFVLSNVDTVAHDVWLLVDPWNEFVRWKPGVTVVSDEETVPNNGYDKEYVLPPQSRTTGTLTSDDMHEIAIKLASVENFLASPQAKMTDAATTDSDAPSPVEICNNIFEYQNRSNSTPPDLFYTPWIPPLIAGVTGFDLGIRMEGDADTDPDAGGGNVAVEITMEIRDLNGNRFVAQDSTDATIGKPPKTLSPPAARF